MGQARVWVPGKGRRWERWEADSQRALGGHGHSVVFESTEELMSVSNTEVVCFIWYFGVFSFLF